MQTAYVDKYLEAARIFGATGVRVIGPKAVFMKRYVHKTGTPTYQLYRDCMPLIGIIVSPDLSP